MCKAVGIPQTSADLSILERLAALLKKYDTGAFLPRAAATKPHQLPPSRTEGATLLPFDHRPTTNPAHPGKA